MRYWRITGVGLQDLTLSAPSCRQTEAARRASEAKAALGAVEAQPLKQSMLLRGSADAGICSAIACKLLRVPLTWICHLLDHLHLLPSRLPSHPHSIINDVEAALPTSVPWRAVTVAFGGVTTGASSQTHTTGFDLAGLQYKSGFCPSGDNVALLRAPSWLL
jgi:hypothetical protein